MQLRTVLIILSLILHRIITALMMSIGGKEDCQLMLDTQKTQMTN